LSQLRRETVTRGDPLVGADEADTYWGGSGGVPQSLINQGSVVIVSG